MPPILVFLALLAPPQTEDLRVSRAVHAVDRLVSKALSDPSARPDQVDWRGARSVSYRIEGDDVLLRMDGGRASYIAELDLVNRLTLSVHRPTGFDRGSAVRLTESDCERIAFAIVSEKIRSPFYLRAEARPTADTETHAFIFTRWREGLPVFDFGPVSSVHIDAYSGLPRGVSNIYGHAPEVVHGRSYRTSEADAESEALRVYAALPPMVSPRLVWGRRGWAIPHFANGPNEMGLEHRAASDQRKLIPVFALLIFSDESLEGNVSRFVVVDAHTGRGLAVRELRMGHQLGGAPPPAPPSLPTSGPARLAGPSGVVSVTLRPSDAPFPSDDAVGATLVAGDAVYSAKVAKGGRLVRAGARTYALAKPLTRGDLKVFAPRPFGKQREPFGGGSESPTVGAKR